VNPHHPSTRSEPRSPYGLRVCDFDRADLEAMGLDVAALDDAGLLEATDKSNDCVPDDDVPF
jgi:hypothetical protein